MQPYGASSNQPNLNRTILFIVGGLILVGSIVLIVWTSFRGPGSSQTTSSPKPYVSPAPTAMASLPKAPNQPKFTGFNILIDDGLSSNQLTDITFSLSKFNKTLAAPAQAITLNANTLTFAPNVPDAPSRVLSFQIVYDTGAVYKVTVRYFNTSAAQTVVANSATGQTLFDSGTVDVSAGIGD